MSQRSTCVPNEAPTVPIVPHGIPAASRIAAKHVHGRRLAVGSGNADDVQCMRRISVKRRGERRERASRVVHGDRRAYLRSHVHGRVDDHCNRTRRDRFARRTRARRSARRATRRRARPVRSARESLSIARIARAGSPVTTRFGRKARDQRTQIDGFSHAVAAAGRTPACSIAAREISANAGAATTLP